MDEPVRDCGGYMAGILVPAQNIVHVFQIYPSGAMPRFTLKKPTLFNELAFFSSLICQSRKHTQMQFPSNNHIALMNRRDLRGNLFSVITNCHLF